MEGGGPCKGYYANSPINRKNGKCDPKLKNKNGRNEDGCAPCCPRKLEEATKRNAAAAAGVVCQIRKPKVSGSLLGPVKRGRLAIEDNIDFLPPEYVNPSAIPNSPDNAAKPLKKREGPLKKQPQKAPSIIPDNPDNAEKPLKKREGPKSPTKSPKAPPKASPLVNRYQGRARKLADIKLDVSLSGPLPPILSSSSSPTRKLSSPRTSSSSSPRTSSSSSIQKSKSPPRKLSQRPQNQPKKTLPECLNHLDVDFREHQLAVAKHIENHKGLIVVHSIGSGKTLTAIAALQCVLSNDPTINVIIVAGKTLKTNFVKEFKNFGIDYDEIKDRIQIMTYEGFTSAFKKNQINCSRAMLIIDEAHRLRTEQGQTVKAALKCAQSAHRVLLLTATPLVNGPEDVLNLIQLISEPEEQAQFQKFAKMTTKQLYKTLSSRTTFNKLFGCKFSYYQRSIDDPDFPRVDERIVKLKMGDKYYQDYLKVQTEEYKEGQRRPDTLKSKIRQFSSLQGDNNPKIEWLEDHIKKAPHKQRIIFSHFVEKGIRPLEAIMKKFNVKYSVITGDVDEDELRKKAVEDYNNKRVNTMVLSMKAGGEGLDLKNTEEIILVEPGWNESEIRQAIGRGVRFKSHPGKDRATVVVYRLLLTKPKKLDRKDGEPDTIDEYLDDLAKEKQSDLDEWMKKIESVSIEKDRLGCKRVKQAPLKAPKHSVDQADFGDDDFSDYDDDDYDD
jgi:SNF2 family DNA or RNA helicase